MAPAREPVRLPRPPARERPQREQHDQQRPDDDEGKARALVRGRRLRGRRRRSGRGRRRDRRGRRRRRRRIGRDRRRRGRLRRRAGPGRARGRGRPRPGRARRGARGSGRRVRRLLLGLGAALRALGGGHGELRGVARRDVLDVLRRLRLGLRELGRRVAAPVDGARRPVLPEGVVVGVGERRGRHREHDRAREGDGSPATEHGHRC